MLKKITKVDHYLKTYGQDLPLLEDPHPLLREKSEAFKDSFHNLPILKALMIEKMRTHHGIGLAAPQVGLSSRILVMDVITKSVTGEVEKEPLMLVNPKIISQEGSCSIEEGCLSVPEQKVTVPRFQKVLVEFLNEKGKLSQREFEDINAICVQHEIDHLDGKLMIDYLLNPGLK